VFDPVVAADAVRQQGCEPVSLDELLAASDVVTLHCPSNEHTRGLLGRERIAAMKAGSVLVNVGRGDLVDPDALTDSLARGHLSGAALDVFQPEPIPADHPILKMDQVIVAAHVASASVPAVRKLRETAARIAALAVQGQPLPNIVNP